MRRSLGFASATTDYAPSSGSLSLRVPASWQLASPVTATRRFIMQKARRHRIKPAPTACRRMVSGTISLSSSECFSPFPHGTRSLSVSREYLALPDGPGGFAQDSTCPALLRIPIGLLTIRVRNCHPLWLNFPDHSALDQSATSRSYYPASASLHLRFGLFPVRSPLLGESLLFSLPAGTKMFQFPALASLIKHRDNYPSGNWVVPFGNRGVKGHLHLARDYRSLSRPSSPP